MNIVAKLYRKVQKHGYECHAKRCEDYQLRRIEFGDPGDKWEIHTSFGNSSGETMFQGLLVQSEDILGSSNFDSVDFFTNDSIVFMPYVAV